MGRAAAGGGVSDRGGVFAVVAGMGMSILMGEETTDVGTGVIVTGGFGAWCLPVLRKGPAVPASLGNLWGLW